MFSCVHYLTLVTSSNKDVTMSLYLFFKHSFNFLKRASLNISTEMQTIFFSALVVKLLVAYNALSI